MGKKDLPAFLEAENGKAAENGTVDCTKHVLKVLAHLEIDALVAIGGDDTLSYAARLHQEGVPVVCVPKTMDNDVYGTDYCIGFSTAVTRSVEFILALRTPTGSHERIAVVELFGRYSGETSLISAYLAGVDRAIISEIDFDMDWLAELPRHAKPLHAGPAGHPGDHFHVYHPSGRRVDRSVAGMGPGGRSAASGLDIAWRSRVHAGCVEQLSPGPAFLFAIRDLLRVVYMLVEQHAIGSPGLSGFATSGGLLPQLLSRLDIFVIWYVILLIMGFTIGDGLARGKAVVDVLVVTLLVLLAQAGLGTLVSGMGGQAIQRPFF